MLESLSHSIVQSIMTSGAVKINNTRRTRISNKTSNHYINVLFENNSIELANKIKNCAKSRYCSSIYCNRCRNRNIWFFQERSKEYIASQKIDAETVLDRFKFVTILFELTPLNALAVAACRERAQRELRALRKKFPRSWLNGSFEYELIPLQRFFAEHTTGDDGSSDDPGGTSRKLRTLSAMAPAGNWAHKLEYVVLVHAHILVDLADHDEEAIKAWLYAREFFNHIPNAIDVKDLYRCNGVETPENRVELNIAGIANYILKDIHIFSNSYKYHTEKSSLIPNQKLALLIEASHKSSKSDGREGIYNRLIVSKGRK